MSKSLGGRKRCFITPKSITIRYPNYNMKAPPTSFKQANILNTLMNFLSECYNQAVYCINYPCGAQERKSYITFEQSYEHSKIMF